MADILKAHRLALECVERANGMIGAVRFFVRCGSEQPRSVEANKTELLGLQPEFFRALQSPGVADAFRRAHFERRAEVPDWLRAERSAHDAAFGFVSEVTATCHNATVDCPPAGRWKAIVNAVARLRQFPLTPLDFEFQAAKAAGEPPISAKSNRAGKNKGGRTPEWDDLWDLIQVADAEGTSDRQIAATYRKRYSRKGRDHLRKVTEEKVAEVRKNRGRKQNHD